MPGNETSSETEDSFRSNSKDEALRQRVGDDTYAILLRAMNFAMFASTLRLSGYPSEDAEWRMLVKTKADSSMNDYEKWKRIDVTE
jgi:hypothetical protein